MRVTTLFLLLLFCTAGIVFYNIRSTKQCCLDQQYTKTLDQTMYIPKIIHQTWKTKNLPSHYKKWSETWKQMHPDYTYRLWTDEDLRELIQEDFPWFLETYDSFDLHIKRVDAARYFILYKYGGVYADLDFASLKNIEPVLQGRHLVLGWMGLDKTFPHAVPNALMASIPQHPLWMKMVRTMESRKHVEKNVEYVTGPVALYDTLKGHYDRNVTIEKPHVFYPINWNEQWNEAYANGDNKKWSTMSNLELSQHFPHSYAITFWTGSWK